MPLFLRDELVLLWTISLWFCIKTAYSDVLPYGERIRPLKGVITKVKLTSQILNVPQCDNCYNKTSAAVTKKEQSPKIEKRIDSRPLGLNEQNVNPLEKTQQTASPIYSGYPKENINNRGATFFFTQVEPHRYEYRAMFQHHRDNFQHREIFQPFVHNFDPFSRDFPPLPKFPDFPQIFSEHKDPFSNIPEHKDPFPNIPDHKDPFPNIPYHQDPFPNIPNHKDPFPNFPDHKNNFPNFPEFTFPTLPPAIKRAWEPDTEVQTQRPALEKDFVPIVKNYDVVLGHTRYPKIFQFNEERINIEDFDREKKLRLYKMSNDGQNEIEPENVKRDQLLILHGGIFTVQEPPLFNKQVKKIRKSRIFGTKVS